MAYPAGKTPLPGYPQSFGDKIATIFDRLGPSSYTQFSTPSTGGDVTKAASGGYNLGGFDWMSSGVVDDSGQIVMYCFPTNGGYGNAVPSYTLIFYSLVTATLGGQAQTAGAQIAASTNLSTFSWRLFAIAV